MRELNSYVNIYKGRSEMSNFNTTLRIKIDVTKIDKARLYKGQKGTYLTMTVMLDETEDRFGNYGLVLESISKEEKEQGVEATILGNVTGRWDRKGKKEEAPVKSVKDNDDDLPF
jgi:hypothetical protein